MGSGSLVRLFCILALVAAFLSEGVLTATAEPAPPLPGASETGYPPFSSVDSEGQTIVVGGDYNFIPFEFPDENGRPTGYNSELIRAVAREMGLKIEIRLGPWADIVKGLESGEIDIIQGMFYTPERDLKFDFSQPHSVYHYVGVVRKGEGPPPDDIAGLKGKRLVVQRGDVAHDYLVEKGLDNQLVLVESQEDALAELSSGLHDCALAARISSLLYIRKHGWKNLELGRRPFISRDYCFAVAEGRKALLVQFNEGLKVLSENNEYRRIYDKWLGVYKERPPTLMIALRYSVIVLVPLLLVLLAAFVWSWSLRRKVAARTLELKESMDRFRILAESAPVGIVIFGHDLKTLHASKRFTEFYGYTLEDMPDVEHWWRLAYPDETIRQQIRKTWNEAIKKAENTGSGIEPMEFPVTCKNGAVLQTEFRLAQAGGLNFVIFTDVSENRKLESRLRQAQKMEAVGRLAGGVAHDFNNMLGVILGHAELAMSRATPDDPLRDNLTQIFNAARRSADITRQLLAFARKQTIAPRVLNLNETIDGMLKMLRRLIGEDIDLVWLPGKNARTVKMDPSQIDQILANLCVNARDAITDIGKITIETGTKAFDKAYCAGHPGFEPGDFVLLAVSDNGAGMDRWTLDNLFEPFFTTKAADKGTGLGLATVYGIVKQNKGFINVYSEPGHGSTFRIYLPRHDVMTEQVSKKEPQAEPDAHGTETILLVEDETAILELTAALLEQLGYIVLPADTPDQAICLAREHTGRIHLLITDVVMPGMNGRDLARTLTSLYPDMKSLFISGYTANVIAHHGVLDEGVQFLQKPFSMNEIAVKVRLALNEKTE